MKRPILIEVSKRHAHLTKNDLKILFGVNCNLNSLKELSQPGQFVSDKKIILFNYNKKIENVRVLGPERKESQIELSRTDCQNLNVTAPLRDSGDLDGTPGIKIQGSNSILNLKKGVIIAKKHLHVSEIEADEIGLKQNEKAVFVLIIIKILFLIMFLLE